MKSERGLTLIELVIVVALAALVLVTVAAYSVPMIARQAGRSGIYDVQNFMQLARIESVKRNQSCRVEINTGSRQLQVLDTMGTAGRLDDVVLYETTLNKAVSFAAPDAVAPVTLQPLPGPAGRYETIFDSDGIVTGGVGRAVVLGGDLFLKIEIFKAGGTHIDHWSGSAWVTGS
jgi:prepilin-type N-terminal cleavage/methylation domain-containing protein